MVSHNHKGRSIFIIVILIFSVLILSSCSIIPEPQTSPPRVIAGEIDLTGWDFAQRGAISLDGPWVFYWRQLLNPVDFKQAAPEPIGLIKVPGSWAGKTINGERLGSYGFATYRLKIKLNRTGETLAVKMPKIATAYRFWVDDKLLHSVGQVGTDQISSVPYNTKGVITFIPNSTEVQLLFQISNFVHQKAGIMEGLEIGTETTISEAYAKSVGLEMAFLGSLVIMGFYHLGLYILRPKERETLFFGLMCLIVSIRILLAGEIFITKLYPDFNWILGVKLEYISIYIGVSLMVLFINKIYPLDLSPKFARLCLYLGLAYSIITLITPVKTNTKMILSYEIFLLITSVYLLVVVIIAVLRKREGIALFSMGTIILILTIVIDILYFNELISFGNVIPLGLFTFILLQSLVISSRYAKTFRRAEEMSMELAELNVKLEEKINDRTTELKKINHQLTEANILLQNLSYLDALTDIPNRRAFQNVLDKEWKNALRLKLPISVIMLDIDFFKAYNDHYGHLAGDDCLKEVSDSIQAALKRPRDFAARYGGEEYAIILPETEAEGARKVAAEVMKSIADRKIPHENSAVSDYITVSIGIASVTPENENEQTDIVVMADMALYRSKNKGRNMISSAGEEG